MVKSKTPLQFVAFTLFLLHWQPIKPIRAGHGMELEIGYDYSEGSGTGPEHWGELRKEWKACKDEKLQSPINLLDDQARKAVSRVYDLKMNYKPSNATMMNEGHAISLEWEGDAGSIQINGTDYFLKQCHWHRSSEHFINGRRYDLELHMVHRSRNNRVAVVAYLYQIGKRSPVLAKMNNMYVSSLSTGLEKEINLGVANPRTIIQPSSQFYRYMGSLTTPPCTGGVIWSVNKKVLSISKGQLRFLERYGNAKMNARPLQPLNGRDISLLSWPSVGIA
ncbi:hypothetical protein ACLB2K_056436 [Fragaria x ananassa]